MLEVGCLLAGVGSFTLYSGVSSSETGSPLPPAWKNSLSIWRARCSRACMWFFPGFLGTVRTQLEMALMHVSQKLASTLGGWGGGGCVLAGWGVWPDLPVEDLVQ